MTDGWDWGALGLGLGIVAVGVVLIAATLVDVIGKGRKGRG